MVTRIVHMSDLHFPSRDAAVAQILQDAIIQKHPDILLITGDIANHPSLWWPFGRGAWVAARNRLQEIKTRLEDVVILMLPGNHDVLVSGLGGWCWPADGAFNFVFRAWRQPAVY